MNFLMPVGCLECDYIVDIDFEGFPIVRCGTSECELKQT